MSFLIKKPSPWQLKDCDCTAETFVRNRRQLLKSFGAGSLALASMPAQAQWLEKLFADDETTDAKSALTQTKTLKNYQPDLVGDWQITPEEKATSYNNFYEFGTRKMDPLLNSKKFIAEPWTLEIGGEVEKPLTIDVWELIHSSTLEERIYRLRCVEAWSMVIPWIGIELNKLLAPTRPTSKAKFVAFRTLFDPEQMPAQDSPWGEISFPYREGLRIDEAMHPLTMMVVGMYGKTLPAQNGAPIRLMSPWKYGFKAIKSIVRIDLVEKMPATTWAMMSPGEYGFYANVNPKQAHPRWSQATERFIGESRFAKRQETLPYNGYGEAVAQLYAHDKQ